MFLIGNALASVAELIRQLSQIYVYVLIGHVIISWVNADPNNPIVRFVHVLTEPFLRQIRRFVPSLGGLDFSVIVAILLVQVVIGGFLVRTLFDLSQTLR